MKINCFLFCRIFKEIYLEAPPILKDVSQDSIDIDYKEYIDDPIDFNKSKYIIFI